MADKYFQMTQRNAANTDWDNLYPEGKFETAGGTATAITLTIPNLGNGISKTFIASADNNGAATTINGKNLYKPNTTTVPTVKVGKAYTVWYNASGDCFFIKASAEGTAVAANVLAGTTFSNDVDTGIPGEMTNHGAVTIMPGTADQTISAGYISSTTVKGEPNLIPPNIKEGVSEYGVVGTLEEKQDFSDYLANIPSNGVPIGFIEGEGIWIIKTNTQTGTDNNVYCLNSAGTILKTVTLSKDPNYAAVQVTKNYILWYECKSGVTSRWAYITDHNGNIIKDEIDYSSYNGCCINPYTQKVYSIDSGSMYIYDFSGTQLHAIYSGSNSRFTTVPLLFIPIKGGALLGFSTAIYIINDAGTYTEIGTNLIPTYQLFNSAFKLS